jgi:plastocyanin
VTITIDAYHYAVSGSARPGAAVRVINRDDVAHTVTAVSGHAFDDRAPGDSMTRFTAPRRAGEYPFYCRYHANMHGSLTVR